ncbi:MAG: glutamate--tRNA ligase [Gammaproteobacteria bacterium]
MTVRTRFAPSPTGFLHIGGARTALYCWLFARRHHGAFILRIEDTDRERSTQQSIDAILDSMAWLQLDYDEGPFYQTQHFTRYREVLDQLLAEGKAYRCNCSKERLEALRAEQLANKQKPRYDGYCRERNLPASNEPFVIRFRNPLTGEVTFEDQVRGKVTFANNELDDLILARSNGTPTYNFTVVVDDWDMRITHVIRGDDHLNNTPRQINILKALGAQPPIYAHLPMILGPDGKRFSKRHGAESVMQYRQDGFLPDALLNYLVRLGWSHGDQEIFSRAEMINYFDLRDINKAPAAYNRDKLLWLNQHYIKNADPSYVAEQLAWQLSGRGVQVTQNPPLTEIVAVQRERSKTLAEMAEKSRFFYAEIQSYSAEAQQHLTTEALPMLKKISQQLAELTDWQSAPIHQLLADIATQADWKMAKVAQPIRAAITGTTVSPPIDITLQLLGREKTLVRLQQAINWIQEENHGEDK